MEKRPPKTNDALLRLKSLSRNLRNEIKKSGKVYFYDNCIRNAVINNIRKTGHEHEIVYALAVVERSFENPWSHGEIYFPPGAMQFRQKSMKT